MLFYKVIELRHTLKIVTSSTSFSLSTTMVDERQAVKRFVAVLDRLQALADDTPLVAQEEGRYGNKAFRTWHERMCEVCLPAEYVMLSSLRLASRSCALFLSRSHTPRWRRSWSQSW